MQGLTIGVGIVMFLGIIAVAAYFIVRPPLELRQSGYVWLTYVVGLTAIACAAHFGYYYWYRLASDVEHMQPLHPMSNYIKYYESVLERPMSQVTLTQVAVTTARVNMRTGPGTHAEVLRTLPEDLEIMVLLEDPIPLTDKRCIREGDWFRVRVGDDYGWVHGEYIAPAKTLMRQMSSLLRVFDTVIFPGGSIAVKSIRALLDLLFAILLVLFWKGHKRVDPIRQIVVLSWVASQAVVGGQLAVEDVQLHTVAIVVAFVGVLDQTAFTVAHYVRMRIGLL